MLNPLDFAKAFAKAQDSYDNQLPKSYTYDSKAEDYYLKDAANVKRIASVIAAQCVECAETSELAADLHEAIYWDDMARAIQAVFQGAPDTEIGRLFQKAITNAMPRVIENELMHEWEKQQ